MNLESVYSYFRSYDKSGFQVVACQGNEPSEADVAAFEGKLGFRLPDDFRAFTKSSLGGLFMEAREEIWPRAKKYDVAPFWSFLYGIKVFGIAAGIPDWLDIRVQFDQFRPQGLGEYVPFLQVEGDADKYCFSRSGGIVRWDHETGVFEPVRLTFPQLLLEELHDLEKRKDRKVRGEDRR